jgi:tol-pal system protein YbgF
MAMMDMRRTYLLLIAGALWLLPTGCFWFTTKHEGQKLRKEVNGLEQRVETKEGDLQSKIAELERVLEEATKVLRRNSADLGADFEAQKQELRRLDGLIADAKIYADEVKAQVTALEKAAENDRGVMDRRVASLEERLAALEEAAKVPPPTPKSADELYREGKAAFDAGDFTTAHNLLKQLVARYPGHGRADDSQYYRGEAYFKEKDYDSAIREFQKVVDKFDTSPLADDALFRAGEAAQNLKRCSEARAYFGLLRQKYSKSSLANKAKDKDAELKRDAKNKKKCSS